MSDDLKPCPLQKRINQYLQDNNRCLLAVPLILELQAHLKAANINAERQYNFARYVMADSRKKARAVKPQGDELAAKDEEIRKLKEQYTKVVGKAGGRTTSLKWHKQKFAEAINEADKAIDLIKRGYLDQAVARLELIARRKTMVNMNGGNDAS